MGSCTSKYNVKVDTPNVKHTNENKSSTVKAVEGHEQATEKPKSFTINREHAESESSLSLDTRIHTYDSVSDEEEEKEKLYEVRRNLLLCFHAIILLI